MWNLRWTSRHWGRFSQYFGFLCQSFMPSTAPQSPPSIIQGWYNRSINGLISSILDSTTSIKNRPLANEGSWWSSIQTAPCSSCYNLRLQSPTKIREYKVSQQPEDKIWFLQEPHGVTTQKTPFFIVTAVKTSNLTRYGRVLKNCLCCMSWGFHGGDYEECRLLGCYAVWLLLEPTFWRNV
jgi:hypothetical protein